MNDNKIKLLEAPQAEPQQPMFPRTSVNLVAEGMLINVALAPGLSLGQVIDANSMDRIAKDWITARTKAKQNELAVIRQVNKSKL
jgi:hypothetical protein